MKSLNHLITLKAREKNLNKLSCSSIESYLRCPAKKRLEEDAKDTESIPSLEGTLCHLVSATLLKVAIYKKVDADHVYSDASIKRICNNFKKTALKKGNDVLIVECSEDTIVYALRYVSIILNSLQGFEMKREFFHIEKRIAFGRFVFKIPFEGTPDAIYFNGTSLYVYDLKSGRIRHSPAGNPQLLSYAYLFYFKTTHYPNDWSLFPNAIFRENNIDVNLVIIQPMRQTAFKIFTFRLFDEFLVDCHNLIDSCNTIATAPAGMLKPVYGEKQCQYCKAKVKCSAFYKIGSIENDELVDIEDTLGTISDEALINQYEKVALFTSFCDSVKDEMKFRLERFVMEGYTLSKPRMMKSWKSGKRFDPMVFLLGDALFEKKKFISPAKAIAKFGLKSVSKYIEVKPGAQFIKKETKND